MGEINEGSDKGILVAFQIKDLFGKYDYSLDFSQGGDGSGRRLSLLYGGNGSGKTNILTLIWHIISESDRSGHRGAIGRTPFKSAVLILENGDEIYVDKETVGTSSYVISVMRGGSEYLKQTYKISDGRVQKNDSNLELDISDLPRQGSRDWHRLLESIAIGRNDDAYIPYLQELSANPHFLADDRQIHGDDFDDKYAKAREFSVSERVRLRNRKAHAAPEGIEYYGDFKPALARELITAINRVNENLRQLVFSGNTTGSQSTDHIYLELLRRISSSEGNSQEGHDAASEFIRRVESVADRTRKYSEFGLIAPLSGSLYTELIRNLRNERLGIAEDVLKPYLDAQNARMDALQDAETLIRTLVDSVNSFFDGKHIQFDVRKGVSIVAEDGSFLLPEQLSSGERQLLLLMLNTVLARTGTRLLLIDEPEISLNVKWQRKLTPALMACAKGSNVQFIMATHSVEIITGNVKNLCRLSALN